jgi:hypothetical protein
MNRTDIVARRQRERLRRQFRPASVRLLFIGESPPASGRFFYRRDSGLYRAMREAFQEVDPAIADSTFLAAFQEVGCYLFDLCPEPVYRLGAAARRNARQLAERRLSLVIGQLQPAAIATLVRSIEGNALASIAAAHWRGLLLHLPYPGRWKHHRQTFVRELAPIIRPLLLGRTESAVDQPLRLAQGITQ